MRKMMIAAVAGMATVVPVTVTADDVPTIYGNFRATLRNVDLGSGADDTTDMENNASRLGVKGTLGTDRLKAIYHLQMGADNDRDSGTALTTRFFFAGLKGAFGSLIYGTHSTGYKMPGVRLDPFYDTSVGTADSGSNYGLSALNNGFTSNSLAYVSPKLGNVFAFNAGIYFNLNPACGSAIGNERVEYSVS